MQEDRGINARLTAVIQELQEATLKKVEEVKHLEDKVTKLSIENIKLQNTINNLKKSLEKNSHESKQESQTPDESNSQDVENNQPAGKEENDSIDISINQLKSILNESQK